ncbi:MAG: hypothetical protein ABEJ27_04415 [Halodesulfurarchaeum sp.]
MALADIAEGVVSVAHQRDRGVATVDRTADALPAVLADCADDLPVSAAAAQDVVEAYIAGRSVEDAAAAADLAPLSGAKTLHLLGFEGLSPLSPLERDILRDWMAGELSRADALELTGAGPTAFALAAYIETHDPIPAARDRLEDALFGTDDAMVAKRDALADTMSDATDLR